MFCQSPPINVLYCLFDAVVTATFSSRLAITIKLVDGNDKKIWLIAAK